MKEPKRFDEEKYKRMLALSESIKLNRPAEGKIINMLIEHVHEMYEYVDYLQGTELGMDDNALERLGVPEAVSTPARTGTRRRTRNTRNRPSRDAWQAPRTDLSWMDDLGDPPF